MDNSLTLHHHPDPHPNLNVPDAHQDIYSKNVFGFWIYLMTDCLLFASLFSTYAVLHKATFGGPSSKELFNLTIPFAETMILLTSSLTCGLSVIFATKIKKNYSLLFLSITFLLGISFLFLEIQEFYHLIQEGHSWNKSAFLSSFFTLVGTHGLHITAGLIWLAVLFVQIVISSINEDTFRRLAIFSLFWHFLDLIWISIFTFVYLLGVA